MEVKTRSGNCLWFSGLFGWSTYPSLSYLPFQVFSFVRILLFILMPTFYTGILTRPFFFTVGEPGFVPVVLTQLHKSLALLVLDHPIVLQPLAMEGYKGTPSSRMWASVYVHLILLPAYERVTVTDLLFKKKLFFFWSCSDALRRFGCYAQKTAKAWNHNEACHSYSSQRQVLVLAVNHLVLHSFGCHVMQKHGSRSSKKHFSVKICVSMYFQQSLYMPLFPQTTNRPVSGPLTLGRLLGHPESSIFQANSNQEKKTSPPKR